VGSDPERVVLSLIVADGQVHDVRPSCICATIVDLVRGAGRLEVLVEVELPFDNGGQSFILDFLDSGGKRVSWLPVTLMKGDAGCFFERAKLVLENTAEGASHRIKMYMPSGGGDTSEVSVCIKNGKVEVPLASAFEMDGIYEVTVPYEHLRAGVNWIVVRSGSDEFRKALVAVDARPPKN
jgi:hypothetical protein